MIPDPWRESDFVWWGRTRFRYQYRRSLRLHLLEQGVRQVSTLIYTHLVWPTWCFDMSGHTKCGWSMFQNGWQRWPTEIYKIMWFPFLDGNLIMIPNHWWESCHHTRSFTWINFSGRRRNHPYIRRSLRLHLIGTRVFWLLTLRYDINHTIYHCMDHSNLT